MAKVFIYEYGCELRFIDANKFLNYLKKNDHKIVDRPKDADIILFLSCANTNTDVESSLNIIKKFKKYNAELIVAGCLPDIEKEKLDKIFSGKTISTKNLEKIDEIFPESKIAFSNIDDINTLFQSLELNATIRTIKNLLKKSKLIEKNYVKIKLHVLNNLFYDYSLFHRILSNRPFNIRVTSGCLGDCSYCAIKKAIGTIKSKSLDQCITELKKGLNAGYKDFFIDGDEVGSYGIDIGSNLPELLYKIIQIPGNYKISIRNLSPQWIVKYSDTLEEISKKITILDIPIQSASPRILKLMNRYSDMEKITNAIKKINMVSNDLILMTDYILGFPTETDEEFRETLNFIKEMGFNGYIFPFSCREGTKASKIEPKISKKEISRRLLYARKFLKKSGYQVFYNRINHRITFDKVD